MGMHHRRPQRPTSHRAETAQLHREPFASAGSPAPAAPSRRASRPHAPDNPEEMSTEDFYRELFAQAQGKTTQPQALGPRSGLEPPALPARFRRVRGGDQLVSYELLVGEDGRIAAKHESVAGNETYFIYEYDDTGHLLRAWRDGHLVEEYAYDPRGARIASWNGKDGQWKYTYDQGGRLTAAGPWRFGYAADDALREAWTPQAAYFLSYSPAGGMSRVVLPGNRVLRCETMPPALPTEKYVDARPVESLTWRSPLQLATYRDRDRGVTMQFHYTGQGRLPSAVTVQTPQGAANYLLGYDQVGSVKAVAAMDGENEGRVVKLVDYDSFGNVLSDSNPALFMPLAFAGGLRDRFTGLMRFLHRDYDPTVGRFTAPDPLGDTGGDHDLYDYCVDEPVGRVDPEGLEGEAAVASGGFFNGIGDWFGDMAKKIGGLFSPDEAQAAPGNQASMAGQTAANSTDTSQTPGASSQSNATATKDQAKHAIFDRKQGTLEVHDGQGTNTWNATSGPHGKGALPPGYTIGDVRGRKPNETSYCDPQGNCWSVDLDPNFPTDRTLLRGHPDGGRKGTEGCIGVEDPNTKPLRDSYERMKGKQLEVR